MLRVTCLLLSLAAVAVPARAAVIDFEGSPDTFTALQTHQGFDFLFTAAGWGVVSADFPCCPGEPVANDTTRLAASGDRGASTARVEMSRNGGGAFSLAGFDAASAFTGTGGTIDIIGNLGGGGTAMTSIAVIDAFASYALDASWIDLDSVVFAAGASGPFQSAGVALDNLLVDEPFADAPAPATLALIGLGLLVAGSLRRRRVA